MNYQRRYWLEKLLVQVTALAVLMAVYFGFGTTFRSWDPAGPITFFATGAFAQAMTFAAMVWLLSIVCALVTVSGRSEGALLGMLIGTAGICLKSPQIRTLLWTHEAGIDAVLGSFALEILFLAGVLIVAVLLVATVRRLVASVRPNWVWTSPLANLTDVQRNRIRNAFSPDNRSLCLLEPPSTGTASRGILAALLPVPPAASTARRELMIRSATCLVTTIAVALALLLVLAQSAQRGQILSSIAVSFCVGVLVAHQFFPTPLSILAWLAPFPAAAALYALGAASVTQTGPLAWTQLPFYARALPIDWFAAGAGGAVLGFWLSSRIHELKILERLNELETEDQDG